MGLYSSIVKRVMKLLKEMKQLHSSFYYTILYTIPILYKKKLFDYANLAITVWAVCKNGSLAPIYPFPSAV